MLFFVITSNSITFLDKPVDIFCRNIFFMTVLSPG